MRSDFILVLALVLTSCSTQRILINDDDHGSRKVDRSFRYAVAYNSADTDTAALCGSKKVTRVEVNRNFFEDVVSVITLGLVSETRVEVFCK